jgi:hypothetical protein
MSLATATKINLRESAVAAYVAMLDATVVAKQGEDAQDAAYVATCLAIHRALKGKSVTASALTSSLKVAHKAHRDAGKAVDVMLTSETAVAYAGLTGHVLSLPGDASTDIAPRPHLRETYATRVRATVKAAVVAGKMPAVKAALIKAKTQADAVTALLAITEAGKPAAPVKPADAGTDDDAQDIADVDVNALLTQVRDAVESGARPR